MYDSHMYRVYIYVYILLSRVCLSRQETRSREFDSHTRNIAHTSNYTDNAHMSVASRVLYIYRAEGSNVKATVIYYAKMNLKRDKFSNTLRTKRVKGN